MLASVTHILPVASFRRNRLLPAPGKVLVRTGQKVNATDVIAEMRIPGQHLFINALRALGVSHDNAGNLEFPHQPGEKVEKGDVLAETKGFFPRILHAQEEGEIVSISNGQILMEQKSASLQLMAGYSGIVSDLVPERGVILEINGALVQGVWGNGKINQGLLVGMGKGATEELLRSHIDVSQRGGVLFAGSCRQAEVLKAASEVIPRGMILSSMSAELIPLAMTLPFPLIVLEGFGNIPMNSVALEVFTNNEKLEVCLNAAARNDFKGERPEVTIPSAAPGVPLVDAEVFKARQTVRIAGSAQAGRVGTLVQIKPGLATMPNQLRVQAADVRFADGSSVTVPLSNLDVLE